MNYLENYFTPEFLDALKTYLSTFGLTKGLFTLFFIGSHIWIYAQYNGRLNDRQKEIDRLADDNKRYREIYLRSLDAKHGYKEKVQKTRKGGD